MRGRGYRFVVEVRCVGADKTKSDKPGEAENKKDTVSSNITGSPPRAHAVSQAGEVIALAQWRRRKTDEKNSQSEKPDAPETIEEQSIVARAETPPPEIRPATQINIVAGEKLIAENNVEKSAHKSKARLTLIAALSLVALAGIGFAVYKFTNPAPPNLKITRLMPDIYAIAAGFTPDGKYVVYVLYEKGKQSVWLKDLTMGGATQILPPTDTPYYDVQFSRDDKMIYYSTNRPNKPNGTLIRVQLRNGTQEEIVSDLVSHVAISPDEKQIVYIKSANYSQLYTANIDGSGERVLSNATRKMLGLNLGVQTFPGRPTAR